MFLALMLIWLTSSSAFEDVGLQGSPEADFDPTAAIAPAVAGILHA